MHKTIPLSKDNGTVPVEIQPTINDLPKLCQVLRTENTQTCIMDFNQAAK